MPLVMTASPAIEPVTLAEAKAHLRLETTAEDVYVAALITTARLHIETALDLALIHQNWSYFADAWPQSGMLALPLRPIATLNAVRLYLPAGEHTTLPLADFMLDGAGLPPRVVHTGAAPVATALRRIKAVEVAFTAGYGAAGADVPAPVRHAILLLLAHWFENREPVEIGTPATRVPDTVSELLQPFRAVRL